jgi:hypothetical protein
MLFCDSNAVPVDDFEAGTVKRIKNGVFMLGYVRLKHEQGSLVFGHFKCQVAMVQIQSRQAVSTVSRQATKPSIPTAKLGIWLNRIYTHD